MYGKNSFTVTLGKRRDRRALIPAVVIPALVMAALLYGLAEVMSQAATTARTEVPFVVVGLWPLYGAGPLHFMFVRP